MSISTINPLTVSEQNHLAIYKRYPLTLSRGEGARVWDTEGREYIDALAGIAVNSVGHCHPKVLSAIRKQAGELIHISNLYYSEPQSRLSGMLTDLSGMDRVFFSNSGAEAVEAALKIARKYGNEAGKKGSVISMENCFHGRTIATIALGKEKYSKPFIPMPSGYEKVPANDVHALEKTMNDDTLAVIIEPVMGEGGVLPVDISYLKRVRELCDKHNALLIFDEIQCGLGRTGKMFAWMHYGVKPDIMCLAKALGGGFPIGATLINDKAASLMAYGDHGTTFGGNPLACAAACAALEVIIEEKLSEQAAEKGTYIMKKIKQQTEGWSSIKEIRGLGLMIGVELSFKGAPVVEKMLEKGVLSNCASDTVMRLVPPLMIAYDDIDKIIDILLESIQECEPD